LYCSGRKSNLKDINKSMNHLKRVFKILFTPNEEWHNIAAADESPASLCFGYVFPMVLAGAIAIFIGYGYVGYDSFLIHLKGPNWGWWFGLRHFISGVAVFFIATYVIDALAPFFSSTKNLSRSAQLVAYSSTPFWLSALFSAFPFLGVLSILGLYGVYLFYVGLPIMKNTPPDKRLIFMLVSAILIIVLTWVLQWITGLILNPLFGDPYASSAEDLRNLMNGGSK
jgi:hypothetical protein